MLFSMGCGRLLAGKLTSSSLKPLVLRACQEVATKQNNHKYTRLVPAIASILTQQYRSASTAARKPGPKKATATKRKTTTTTTATAKRKSAPKKTVVKKKPAPKKKKVVKKVAKKVVKAKKRVKAKPKPKPKPKKKTVAVKKAPNPILAARKTALKPPPRSINGYALFFQDACKKAAASSQATLSASEIAQSWKSLAESEKGAWILKGQERSVILAKEYQEWVAKLSPEQIRVANQSRQKLNKAGRSRNTTSIKDERQVKGAIPAYAFFSKDHFKSPEAIGLSPREKISTAAKAWKALSDAEKKKYEDMKNQDLIRYHQEKLTVYGHK